MPGESTSHQIILKENEAKTQNKAKKSNGKILNQKKKKKLNKSNKKKNEKKKKKISF